MMTFILSHSASTNNNLCKTPFNVPFLGINVKPSWGLFAVILHAAIHRRCFCLGDGEDPSIQVGRCDFWIFYPEKIQTISAGLLQNPDWRIYICMETHLTEQELAQYVDALVLDKLDQLSEEIREHWHSSLQSALLSRRLISLRLNL